MFFEKVCSFLFFKKIRSTTSCYCSFTFTPKVIFDYTFFFSLLHFIGKILYYLYHYSCLNSRKWPVCELFYILKDQMSNICHPEKEVESHGVTYVYVFICWLSKETTVSFVQRHVEDQLVSSDTRGMDTVDVSPPHGYRYNYKRFSFAEERCTVCVFV